MGNETRYLQTDPYTSQYGARQVAGATAGNTAAFQAARSNLSASLARRGLTDSSQLAGGLAGIDSAQAASTAGAQNQLAQAAIRNQGQRISALTALRGGLANQDYARGAGLLGNVASNYLNIGNQERGLDMNAQGAQNSLIGGGAGMIAGAYAPNPIYPSIPGYGNNRTASTTYNPFYPDGQPPMYSGADG